MKSPMLKRRLNPFLLATTILVLSILASLSVLYQGQLSNILQEKNSLDDKLEERNQRIKTLEQEKSNLSERVSSQEGDIETYLKENEYLKSQINSLNLTVERLENRINRLQTDNQQISDQLEDINGTLGFICGNNNTIEDGEDRCNRHGHEYEGS